MRAQKKLQIDYQIFDNLSIPPAGGASRSEIMGRFLWALRVLYAGEWQAPKAIEVEKAYEVDYSVAHSWVTAMKKGKPKALSLPGADILARVCMKEHINADWVLTSRGYPFFTAYGGEDAPPSSGPSGSGPPVGGGDDPAPDGPRRTTVKRVRGGPGSGSGAPPTRRRTGQG